MLFALCCSAAGREGASETSLGRSEPGAQPIAVSPLFPETTGDRVSLRKRAPGYQALHWGLGGPAAPHPHVDPGGGGSWCQSFPGRSSVDVLPSHLLRQRLDTEQDPPHPVRMRQERRAGAPRLCCIPDRQHGRKLPSRLRRSKPSWPFLPLAPLLPRGLGLSGPRVSGFLLPSLPARGVEWDVLPDTRSPSRPELGVKGPSTVGSLGPAEPSPTSFCQSPPHFARNASGTRARALSLQGPSYPPATRQARKEACL